MARCRAMRSRPMDASRCTTRSRDRPGGARRASATKRSPVMAATCTPLTPTRRSCSAGLWAKAASSRRLASSAGSPAPLPDWPPADRRLDQPQSGQSRPDDAGRAIEVPTTGTLRTRGPRARHIRGHRIPTVIRLRSAVRRSSGPARRTALLQPGQRPAAADGRRARWQRRPMAPSRSTSSRLPTSHDGRRGWSRRRASRRLWRRRAGGAGLVGDKAEHPGEKCAIPVVLIDPGGYPCPPCAGSEALAPPRPKRSHRAGHTSPLSRRRNRATLGARDGGRQGGSQLAARPWLGRATPNAALSWPSRPAPAARGCRWCPWSGVGVRAGVAADDAEVEAVEVELPPLMVVIALPAIGQAVVAQDEAGAAALGLQGDDDTGGPGRDGRVVCPAPGEYQAVRRVDLDELAGGLHAVPHQDAVAATGYRL